MSIARHLAELMGGTVAVSSQPGQGSTFSADLRLAPGTDRRVGGLRDVPASWSHEATTIRDLFAGREYRVLLADDNITNQQVALGLLSKMGVLADAVGDGAEVLQALDVTPYDLLLMDVHMPNMDGLEATRRIRSAECGVANTVPLPASPRLPIIAMTANAMQADRENCLEAGMDDYISKPVSPRALATMLEKWLPGNDTAEDETAGISEASPTAVAGSLPILDMSGFMSRLMGDKELAKRVLDGFLEDMPRQLQLLAKFGAEGAVQQMQNQAHRIKGASASVGGDAMSAVALEIETAAEKTGDLVAISASLASLSVQFVQLKEAIARQHEV